MIKYLGSKARYVGVIADVAARLGAVSALDLFTGTTRVAQALKRARMAVTACDSAAYAHAFARCYIATDSTAVNRARLLGVIAHLNSLDGEDGYITETFCEHSRFFQPENGRRVDAIRRVIAEEYADDPLEPLLVTALVEAADRVDSTTGVQMAYLKAWAARAANPLRLRMPALLDGPGEAVLGDACTLAGSLDHFDVAYLDPPYNAHSYVANYHIWETLVRNDAPKYYGVACKRADTRYQRSPFNSRPQAAPALAAIIAALDSEAVIVSCSDEGWVSPDEIVAMCARYERAVVIAFEANRYVGAKIGIHSPAGELVGEVGRLRNRECLVVAGAAEAVEQATELYVGAEAPVAGQSALFV